MTMKEFLNAVVTANVSEEVTNFASAEIAKIDGKNAKRRNTPTASQKANAELLASILFEMKEGGLAEGGVAIASNVGKAFGITTQKASAILQMGVKEGALTETEVKVKGKGKVKGYALTAEKSAD